MSKKIDELRKQFVKASATDGKSNTSYFIYHLYYKRIYRGSQAKVKKKSSLLAVVISYHRSAFDHILIDETKKVKYNGEKR